jgi:hypothetical protein
VIGLRDMCMGINIHNTGEILTVTT